MKNILLLLAVGLSLSCAKKDVSAEEARLMIRGLQGAAAAQPNDRLKIYLQVCSEVASCAGECREALQAAVQSEEQRDTLLRMCFPEHKEAVTAWLPVHLRRVLASGRAALPESERGELDAVARSLEL